MPVLFSNSNARWKQVGLRLSQSACRLAINIAIDLVLASCLGHFYLKYVHLFKNIYFWLPNNMAKILDVTQFPVANWTDTLIFKWIVHFFVCSLFIYAINSFLFPIYCVILILLDIYQIENLYQVWTKISTQLFSSCFCFSLFVVEN